MIYKVEYHHIHQTAIIYIELPRRPKHFSVDLTMVLIWDNILSIVWCSDSKILRLRVCHNFQKVMQNPIFQEGCRLDLLKIALNQTDGAIMRKSVNMSCGRIFLQTLLAGGQSLNTWVRSSTCSLQIEQNGSWVSPRLDLSQFVKSLPLRRSQVKVRTRWAIGSRHTFRQRGLGSSQDGNWCCS